METEYIVIFILRLIYYGDIPTTGLERFISDGDLPTNMTKGRVQKKNYESLDICPN